MNVKAMTLKVDEVSCQGQIFYFTSFVCLLYHYSLNIYGRGFTLLSVIGRRKSFQMNTVTLTLRQH